MLRFILTGRAALIPTTLETRTSTQSQDEVDKLSRRYHHGVTRADMFVVFVVCAEGDRSMKRCESKIQSADQ